MGWRDSSYRDLNRIDHNQLERLIEHYAARRVTTPPGTAEAKIIDDTYAALQELRLARDNGHVPRVWLNGERGKR